MIVLKRSVLTEKIARRGLHLSREYSVDPLEVHLVRQLETPATVTFRTGGSASEATALLRAAHQGGDAERLLAQRLYPVLDEDGRLAGVVTRAELLHGAPDDPRPLGALARPAITAHPDETLRTIANRMAAHHITRVVIVPRGDAGGVEGILSLRHLLEARRVDLHEEQHAERLITPFQRTPRPSRTVARGTGELHPQERQLTP
ncbi:CBS domain-containing protein [Streptomyces sp. NPDC056682]|uniref:CBS domain-containing protein n=1 Tax=Streptomyces sp. NPDC056682 TaxID=3345909 RepID=UPI003689D288